jgi:type IX secretion system PorP/SprF family membrane protein
MKRILYILLVMCCILSSRAQFDPQFSQYMYNESFINPAYAGSHDALSITALGRKQWMGFSGAPTNITLSGHTPIAEDKIGIGVNIMNESIGIMYRNLILVNGAYRLKAGNGTFCFGLQGGASAYTERLSQVNTIQKNDQQFIQSTPLLWGPNVGGGLYYYTKTWYAGLSAPRMLLNTSLGNSVRTQFTAGSISYFITGGYVFSVDEDIKLKPSVMLKAAQGSPIQPEVNVQGIYKDMLWLGLAYRLSDAAVAMLGYQINPQFRVGYSFDYTLTKLSTYNSGSHELVLNYTFKYKNKNFTSPRYF